MRSDWGSPPHRINQNISKPMWKAITGTYHHHEVTSPRPVALLLRFPLVKELPPEEQKDIFSTSQWQYPQYDYGFPGFATSLFLPVPATHCRQLAGRIDLMPGPVYPEKCSRKNFTGIIKKNFTFSRTFWFLNTLCI